MNELPKLNYLFFQEFFFAIYDTEIISFLRTYINECTQDAYHLVFTSMCEWLYS